VRSTLAKKRKMVVFEDVISSDEMCSDNFAMKIVDDVLFEIMCSMVVVRTSEPELQDGEANNITSKF
jgi:hypothetical protein